MSLDLMNVFTALDWSKAGKETANLLSIAFNQNSRTGDRVARAVFDDGSVIYKIVTASGIVIQAAEFLPKITSTAQRDQRLESPSPHTAGNRCNYEYFTIHRFKCSSKKMTYSYGGLSYGIYCFRLIFW